MVVINHTYPHDKEHEGTQYTYKHFLNHSTAIDKSCTGTGKTTAASVQAKTYANTCDEIKFLSLTTRTTLSDQHMSSFANLDMKDYRDTESTASINWETLQMNKCVNTSFFHEAASFLDITR